MDLKNIIEKLKMLDKLNGICDDSEVQKEYSEEKAFVVFTEQRGVFFGYTRDRDITKPIKLNNARNCYYWAVPEKPEAKGFMGLAEYGPAPGSRISGRNSMPILVSCVTCMAEATSEAINAWEDGSWE